MTRDEAIAYLKSEGLHVFRRKWSLGDTIGVAALPKGTDDIQGWDFVAYLYPVDDVAWAIADMRDPKAAVEQEKLSLEQAVNSIIATAQTLPAP